MKKKMMLILLSLGICLTLWGYRQPLRTAAASNALSGGARTLKVALAPGVLFQRFHLTTDGQPVDFFVVRMSREYPDLTLDTIIANGSLRSGRESVAQMAQRADGALSAWGDGLPRGYNQVVAAVNGYYFDLESGRPWRGVVQSGWYAQRFDDVESGSGFVWTLDGRAFVGGCVSHRPGKQTVTFENGSSVRFSGVNVSRPKDALVLYTWHFGERSRTDDDGVEILVELDAPLGIAPAGSREQVSGTIRAIFDHQGNHPLPYGYVLLSAHGKARRQVLKAAKVGDRLGIHQEITHMESDCSTPNADDWGGAYAAIGGDYVLLRDRQVQEIPRAEAQQRNARTAVAYNEAFVFLVVADGWNPGVSEGVTVRQLALFLRDVLGATDGITLDSGGSTTMWVNGRVVNNTYCNFTRQCGPEGEPGADGEYPSLEPLVGTALAVIAVQPKERSLTFGRGDAVTLRRTGPLLLGPGWDFPRLETLSPGDEGVILPTLMQLGGLRAENAYWWRVRVGEMEGWVAEDMLYGGATPARELSGWHAGGGRWRRLR